MLKLKAFQVLKDPNRNSSVDFFRGIAIICVVIFHFNRFLPLGNLGVDLFFVISGLLVGGLLTKNLESDKKINFLKFFLQRGFKIWPSFYAFIVFGSLIAFGFYRNSHPEQIIPFWDMKRYLFFYQNYTGGPFHWSFDHVWSLCVEEHFYILLPILFILIQTFANKKHKVNVIFISVILTIIAGIFFKFCSYYFTNSKDTYAGTHNRIDALAWGVLLNLMVIYCGKILQSSVYKFLSFSLGLLILVGTIYFTVSFNSVLFGKIYLHSIVPFSFFLMMSGLYYVDFSRFKVIRFIAYYSYNWYLWHPVFVIFISTYIKNPIGALITYLLITFTVAIFFTVMVEEVFLKRRKKILSRLFKVQTQQVVT
ncbi:acyltransferase [Pedobacter sp. L105]|uniref:acyltransferase family protein n=1 Tax=Pedobacter sp. L105 TaxID=1641871 RepID=UPI00131D3BD5|nr:acyltransferase [Pedobacter sp. L105]